MNWKEKLLYKWSRTYRKVVEIDNNLKNIISCKDYLGTYVNYRLVCFANTFFSTSDIKKATGNLRKLQLVTSYLLQEFKKVCNENNIKFWLQAGTLLGAVRHKGFVLWDDDCDIGMMREDYNKILNILKNNNYDFEIKNFFHLKYENRDSFTNKIC